MTRATLVEQIARKTAELAALVEELAALDRGEQTRGQLAQRCLKFFLAAWKRRYGVPYVGAGVKDIAQLKRLLAGGLTADELEGRMGRYLLSNDPYYAQARHPLAMFVGAVNKFARVPDARPTTDGGLFEDDVDDGDEAIDCRHRPRCKTDVEHTRRCMAERRAR